MLRSIEEIFLNDVVIVKPGDRIPVDGIVCHGLSTVDQSTITGEPFPKVKKTGDAAYAGTFNQQGTLEIRVTRLSSDSILSKVTHLVQEGQSKRALTQTSIERFATYYTPAVFVAAIFLCAIPVFVFLQPFHVWLYRSLVLLVVSCPCALVISTPITIVSALTNAARNGVLIKGGIHLEELSRIHCVAFDKTGTLTLGRPKITSVHSLNSMSAGQIVQIAVALEKRSEHPFAEAFLEYATSNKIPISDYGITDFCAIPGKGIQAMIDHERYFLGSHQFVEDLGVCSSKVEELVDKFQHDDASTVFLANERKILGVFAVEDEVRLQGMNSIRSLHALGIKRTVLLTGDDSTQSATLQRQLSIDELRLGLLPGEKVSAIRDLQRQYGEVAMVGDGINDAPALANASIGIAMGGAGSDIALETADVVLMNDDLTKLPFALRLGKRALSTIKQNIVFALTIKAIFIGLGAFGITSLWLAILADDGVTLLVALNGMRLLRMR